MAQTANAVYNYAPREVGIRCKGNHTRQEKPFMFLNVLMATDQFVILALSVSQPSLFNQLSRYANRWISINVRCRWLIANSCC